MKKKVKSAAGIVLCLCVVCGCRIQTSESGSEKGHAAPLMSNPAVATCIKDGFEAEPVVENGVPTGYICVNSRTAKRCDAWAYFRDECNLTGE